MALIPKNDIKAKSNKYIPVDLFLFNKLPKSTYFFYRKNNKFKSVKVYTQTSFLSFFIIFISFIIIYIKKTSLGFKLKS